MRSPYYLSEKGYDYLGYLLSIEERPANQEAFDAMIRRLEHALDAPGCTEEIIRVAEETFDWTYEEEE